MRIKDERKNTQNKNKGRQRKLHCDEMKEEWKLITPEIMKRKYAKKYKKKYKKRQ